MGTDPNPSAGALAHARGQVYLRMVDMFKMSTVDAASIPLSGCKAAEESEQLSRRDTGGLRLDAPAMPIGQAS